MTGSETQCRNGEEPGADLFDLIPGLAGLLAGPANVIMQLALPAVGHGVLESKVDSGKVTLHPLKRARTTFSYLAVAAMGTDEERAAFRLAVNGAHAQVHSGPDSPVAYNAFDPELQLWVAACLYWGAQDLAERFSGPLDDGTADALYRTGAAFGTSLQVPPDMWPADRAAFAKYWTEALERVAIDAAVHDYLQDLVLLRFLPRPVSWLQGRWNQFVTTGFLPQTFRENMGFSWTERDERHFQSFIRLLAAAQRWLPRVVRRFPFNFYLWDVRLRMRYNLRLV